jgi:hypothetical protein
VLATELAAGQTAAAARVVALAPDARSTGFIVERRDGGPTIRCRIVAGNT